MVIIIFYGKSISIYINFGVAGGTYMVHLTFFVYYSKNEKTTRAWPILKSNSTSFWFINFFHKMNNKKIKGGLKIITKEVARHRCHWAKMSRVGALWYPTVCGQPSCLWGRRELGARTIFFYYSFPNIFCFILQSTTPPWVFIIERETNCIELRKSISFHLQKYIYIFLNYHTKILK